jgi:hypothetical protein
MHRLTTNAVLVTRDRQWLKGAVSTEGRRLLDVLNDPSHKYIRVQGLKISGCNSFTGVAARPEAWIQKSKLDLAILTSEEHETPERRWDNYAPKKRIRIAALASGFELEAYLHRQNSVGNIQSALESIPSSFLPLTSVRISPMQTGMDPFGAGVVLVNRYCITLLAQLEAQDVQTTGSQAKDRFTLSHSPTWDQGTETNADTHLH